MTGFSQSREPPPLLPPSHQIFNNKHKGTAVRKLIRDGYVIKKPQVIHSKFRARRRALEKKKGRHLGFGRRKGTKNARNPVKMLWIKRQRAMRRLLARYRSSGKIDRRMYVPFPNIIHFIECLSLLPSFPARNRA